MDHIKKARGRFSLLAGASLLAASISMGAPVLLTPSRAHAANECGDPNTNGASADTFTCTDSTTFTAITYPLTNGNLTLRLQNDVTVTTGGISIASANANNITLSRTSDSTVNAGDPQIISTSGPGISIVRDPAALGGNIAVTLSENDFGDLPELKVQGTTYGIYLSNAGSGTTTLTTNLGTVTATNGVGVRIGTIGTGNVTFSNAAVVSGTTGSVTVTGVNATVNNNGTLDGAVVFNNTGAATLANGGTIKGLVTFNNTGAVTMTNLGTWTAGGTVNFGSGTSSLSNNILQVVNGLGATGLIQVDGTLTFTSLESFTNAGHIAFGAPTVEGIATDGVANDRLVLGTNFNVAGGVSPTNFPVFESALYMDFVGGGANQTSCAAAVSADCLDIRGYSVTGLQGTSIVLNPVAGNSFSAASKIVLVDAGGGSLASGDFVLSSDSTGYVTGSNGAGIDTGVLIYQMVTDTTADQVYLTAVAPGSATASLLKLAQAPRSVWELGASAIGDRQQDLRDNGGEGVGVWLRGLSSMVDDTAFASFGGFRTNVGYKQETTGVIGGVDIGGDGWSAGASAASYDSKLRPSAQTAENKLSGYGLAAYGSWTSGRLFVDGLVNYTSLDLTSTLSTRKGDAKSTGALAETGWRFALGDRVAFEPLAALEWVSSDGGDLLTSTGATISTDKVNSLDAGLGARLVASMPIGPLTGRFAFTGRAWQPLGDGEAALTVAGSGSPMTATFKDNQDIWGDVGLTAALSGLDERLTLSATAKLQFKEDHRDSQAMVGLRYRF